MVVVCKKNSDEPRITVDFTQLNQYVKWPCHPTQVLHETVTQMPPVMRVFTILDMRHGY